MRSVKCSNRRWSGSRSEHASTTVSSKSPAPSPTTPPATVSSSRTSWRRSHTTRWIERIFTVENNNAYNPTSSDLPWRVQINVGRGRRTPPRFRRVQSAGFGDPALQPQARSAAAPVLLGTAELLAGQKTALIQAWEQCDQGRTNARSREWPSSSAVSFSDFSFS